MLSRIFNSLVPPSGGTRFPALDGLRGLAVIASLGFLIRLVWSLFAHTTPLSDFAGYDKLATHWLLTGHFGFPWSLTERTPLYPGFLAILYLFFGHSYRVVMVAQSLLGGLTCFMLMLIARRAANQTTSILTGIFYAISPTSIVYVTLLASETLAVFLLVFAALLLSYQKTSPRITTLLSVGIGLGFLVLTRPAGLFFMPSILLLIFFWQKRFPRLIYPALVIMSLLLVLSPWLARNYRIGQGFTTISSVGGTNLWMANNPLSGGGFCAASLDVKIFDEKVRDDYYASRAKRWITENPQKYFSLCLMRLQSFFIGADNSVAEYLRPTVQNDTAIRSRHFYYYRNLHMPYDASLLPYAQNLLVENKRFLLVLRFCLLPLFLLGFATGLKNFRRFDFIIAPLLSYILIIILTFSVPRLRELIEPLLLIPASYGLTMIMLSAWPRLRPRLSFLRSLLRAHPR